jgi:hypothetical protein
MLGWHLIFSLLGFSLALVPLLLDIFVFLSFVVGMSTKSIYVYVILFFDFYWVCFEIWKRFWTWTLEQ